MLIDLSVILDQNTPVYPGDITATITKTGEVAVDGFCHHELHLSTHIGTHIDAPSHMIDGGKNLNEFPIEKFSGRGVYIQIDGIFNLEEIKKVPVEEGDIVLFHTGMTEKLFEPAYFEDSLTIPEDVAHYLVEKKIKAVGMDMNGPDKPPFNVHKILLGGEVLIIENLTNVGALAGKKFRVFAFPLKLSLDGSPARVVAEVL